jgi:hypothetical protein
MIQLNPSLKALRLLFFVVITITSSALVLKAQGFPAEDSCPSVTSDCGTPAVAAITELVPSCSNTQDYNLRIEFAAGGTPKDPSAFKDHYWVMQVITKDSCVYITDPFTVGSTSGPTYVATTGNSIVVDLAPEDLTFVTGGSNCTTMSAPATFGGLDSVYISVQQRCDSPIQACSAFSNQFGDGIPFSFDMVSAKSSFQGATDSTLYGYCTDNQIIYVDAIQGETVDFGLAWYKDYRKSDQSVYVCLQDWAPINVEGNYELQLSQSSSKSTPFTQSIADGWTEPGDSVQVSTEELNGKLCYKIRYVLDGDRMINAAMNNKITATAVGLSCETVTEVSIDTAANAFSKFKIGWRANMKTESHKFKFRIYQGGTCDTTGVNPDTVSTRPNIDNSYIHDFLLNSNDDNLSKFTVRDTIAGTVYLSDSFTLDLSTLGISLEGCTCYQAFVYQICDLTNLGSAPRWSTGANATTDCDSCEDGIQNGDETGIDCGGSCAPCEIEKESTCDDGEMNGDETGIDCGGSCTPCEVEETATCDDGEMNGDERGIDCGGSCEPCEVEETATCDDGEMNGDETGIDCGGSCEPCEVEETTTCDDGEMNGDETGIDCGGSCVPCEVEETATCDDGEMNGDETGIDCGGSCEPCITCAAPQRIWVDQFKRSTATLNWERVEGATMYTIYIRLEGSSRWYDFRTSETSKEVRGLGWRTNYEWKVWAECTDEEGAWSATCTFNSYDESSGNCGAEVIPTCEDGEMNGDETGIDCGGSCAPCEVEETPTCEDGKMNGDETGIDCGGSCGPCEVEVVPTCEDGEQNGDETGIDCGGSCTPCETISNDCPTPTDLYQRALGPFSILSWSGSNGNNYDLQIRVEGDEEWTSYQSQVNRFLASRLQRGVVYEWRVRAVCGSTPSEWSETIRFLAGTPGNASGVIVSPVANAKEIEAYPNPVRDILNIVVPGAINGSARVEILGLNGRSLFRQALIDGETTLQVNVSDLPKGLYLIKYESQDQVSLKRILIQ